MGKNRDLLHILLLVLLGMFIPFCISIALTYGLDFQKIGLTFFYFLLIFGVELLVVYLYFSLSNWRANRHLNKYKSK